MGIRMSIYQFDPEDAKRFAHEQNIKYFVRGDELQVGGTQGDLALQGGAEEQACGVACAVEDQEQEVVAQGADEGGDDQTPDGTLDKAEACGLEALTLDHHAGLEGLNADLNDLRHTHQQANHDGGHRC